MNDKRCAEFEKWFTSQIDSEYCSTNVKSLLSECWQAAIASVVVELPSTYYDQFGDLALDYNATIEGFDKAGIRYE